MKHILIIASYGPSLITLRGHLIKKFLSLGYKVSVAAPIDGFSDKYKNELLKLGTNLIFFKLSRNSLNIIKDIIAIKEIYKIIKYLRPNLIISYTIKPVLYTGLILNFFKKISFYPLITGLGLIFIKKKTIKFKILKLVITTLYRYSLKSVTKIIFQNIDDQNLFFKLKIIKDKNLSHIVNGSGVDLNLYPQSPVPFKPVFLMASRLLIEKGVREYIEAAKIVQKKYPSVIFQLAGRFDNSPLGISKEELNLSIKENYINYLGEADSIQALLASCKFYVLPSYREGTPKSILEALSTGRPIITTDVPGCRETVINEKNGLLVPSKDSISLANAMIKLLEEKDDVIKKMAYESYLIAKNKYEINKVNKNIIHIMNL